MEKYENILNLLDEAIQRQYNDLTWYMEQYRKATEEVSSLAKYCEEYRKENADLKAKIKKLEEELGID